MIYAQRTEDNRERLIRSNDLQFLQRFFRGMFRVCLASTNSARVSRLALGDLWGEVGGNPN